MIFDILNNFKFPRNRINKITLSRRNWFLDSLSIRLLMKGMLALCNKLVLARSEFILIYSTSFSNISSSLVADAAFSFFGMCPFLCTNTPSALILTDQLHTIKWVNNNWSIIFWSKEIEQFWMLSGSKGNLN